MPLLTQNSELRENNIHNWSIPAWVVRLSNGKAFNVCPQAGACVKFCYARSGTYNFRNVKAAHVRNLETYLNDPGGWMVSMLDELDKPRFRARPDRPHLPDLDRSHLSPEVAAIMDAGGAVIRVHDSGDFFSEEYLLSWLSVASQTPDKLFYAYTKEVSLFKRVATEHAPPNFLWCYSLGGREDRLIDKENDYHAEVFPSEEALIAAGYFDQEDNDLLCVTAPSNRVGIVANNIPHFLKKQGGRTFGSMEQELESKRHRG